MTQYFETTVKYEKVMEDGMHKQVKEKYLIKAVSYSDAEEQIASESEVLSSGAFEISDIKKARYSEIFINECADIQKFYSCQLEFITLDEKSGKGKKTKHTVLVEADSLSDALKKLNEAMKGTIADYNAVCVKETNIIDVIE